ncbi:MAG: GNAT family N-acetyltransferase [Acidobacteria bacterium]|nr:GNAT family N-acetyltransferase [Acidobacteriota bacterium]MCA1611538.1 GNAT family N-acetyltransferase [Acidobacteriota bacterium]
MIDGSADSIRVRRALPADGNQILALDRELAHFEKLTPPDEEEGRRLLAWIFDEKRLEALVAQDGGDVVGMALFYEGLGTFRAKPFLYLEDLVVSGRARSRRVGEALMAALAREVVARGALRLEWSVLDWNSRAISFYERLGARHSTEWVKYSLEGEELEKLADRG